MSETGDYFGTPEQQGLLRRGRALYDVIKADPHYTYYGRTVGLAQVGDGGVEALHALAHLQGNSNISDVTQAEVPQLLKACEDYGLKVVQYARWVGGPEALSQARASIAEVPLPGDLSLGWISPDTPTQQRAAFAEAALSCGVLPPSMAVLSGALRPGVACFAVDPDGAVVSLAAAAAFHIAGHPNAGLDCWWGMLSTRPARRGARLSILLGAHAIVRMHERYGFARFMTGVEPGNAASEAVCTRLGLARTDRAIIGAADPNVLTSGRMTK